MPLRVVGVFLAVALAAWSSTTTSAYGQFTRGKSTQAAEAAKAAGEAMQQPLSRAQMTPEQIRNLMWLRALQNRSGGGGGVRTGVPQFVPFGGLGGGFGPMPAQTVQPPKADDADAKEKPSAQRKAELRAEREKKQREAREKAKQKRLAASAKAAADKAAKQVQSP